MPLGDFVSFAEIANRSQSQGFSLVDRRFLVVIMFGLGLAGLCVWRIQTNRPQSLAEQMQHARVERPAENFEGVDINNTMFRLERYLGRHRVLVVFFSAEETAAHDVTLLAVRDAFPRLAKNDIKVVGVSTALPQDNRRAIETAGEFPFPVKYGYSSVGVVEAGPEDLLGRHVFCLYPHQSRYVVPVAAVTPLPAGLAPARAVLAANMETALNAVWDAAAAPGHPEDPAQ